MGTNIVLDDGHGGRIRVNPARDVAHYWGQLAAQAMTRLEDESLWPQELAALLKEASVTPADMTRAGLRLNRALRLALRRGPETPKDALTQSGFLTCHPLVRLAVMVRIGQVSLGAWWDGIKDSVVEGTIPACHEDLIRAGIELAAALNETFDPSLPPPPEGSG